MEENIKDSYLIPILIIIGILLIGLIFNKPAVKNNSTSATIPTETPEIIKSFESVTTTSKPSSYTIPVQYVVPTQQPITNSGGSYACNCSKTCTQISSCAEAQYQLNVCGCGARDSDKDGIACDGAPLHCQN